MTTNWYDVLFKILGFIAAIITIYEYFLRLNKRRKPNHQENDINADNGGKENSN